MSSPCYSSCPPFPSCSRSSSIAGRRRCWGRERYLEWPGVCLLQVLAADAPVSTRPLVPCCSSWQSRKTFSTYPRRLSKNLREPARSFSEPHGQLCQLLLPQTASHPGPSLYLRRETGLGSTSSLSPKNPVSCRTVVREL